MTQSAASPHPSNAVATNLFRSWLTATKIPYSLGTVTGIDFVIQRADGGELPVAVDRPQVPEGAISVSRKAMTGKKVQDALAAFWAVTDAAGYPRRRPINRGSDPACNERGNPRKLHYRDEPFLVSIRHTEFRRAPDPTPEQWRTYEPVMRRVVNSFYREYRKPLIRNGMGIDDLMTYARCYLANFCSRHEVPGDPRNLHRCRLYINQRLFGGDGAGILLKKERSVLPDAETANIGVYGRPDADDTTDHAALIEVDEVGAARLERRLKTLPHRQLVNALRQAAGNRALGAAARVAQKRLAEHLSSCRNCKQKGAGEAVPHANRLDRILHLVSFVAAGVKDLNELGVACRLSRRHVNYYLQAAQAIGLLDEFRTVSPRGLALLALTPGSAAERRALRQAVIAGLPEFTWFFDDAKKTQAALTEYLVEHHQLTRETATRRASCLKAWRASLAGAEDAGVEEDVDAAGRDPARAQK